MKTCKLLRDCSNCLFSDPNIALGQAVRTVNETKKEYEFCGMVLDVDTHSPMALLFDPETSLTKTVQMSLVYEIKEGSHDHCS